MRARLALLFLAMITLPLSNSYADEVFLLNGDRLTGEIVSGEINTLILKTDFSNKIVIKRTAIKSLSSDKVITVKLDNGNYMSGTLIVEEDGAIKVKIDDPSTPEPVDFSRIVFINPPPPQTKTVYHGRFNAGAAVESGNTDKESFHADAELIARGITNRLTLGSTYNFSKNNDVENSNNTLIYSKYDHFIDDQWYGYGNGAVTKDKFKDLNLRSTLGLGLGYQFWESELSNLSVEFGPSYVNEDFIEEQDRDYISGRWAVNYDRWVMGKRFQLFHLHEGLIALNNTQDIFIRSRTGIRVPLLYGFAITAEVDIDADNVPSLGNDKVDTKYLLNAGYNW